MVHGILRKMGRSTLRLVPFLTLTSRIVGANFVRCNIDSLFDGPVATGILHVGANAASEAGVYHTCVGANVLFFECDESVAARCQESAATFGQRCVQSCLSNVTANVPFYVSNNDGMSSSLRKFDEHSVLYPSVNQNDVKHVSTTRYDTWKLGIPKGLIPKMNVLVVDVQGNDLEVLEGMGSELDDFEVLLVEVSGSMLYQGQRLAHEIDSFVASKGFHCHAGCEPCEHCDRLFRRSKLRQTGGTVIQHSSTFPCDYEGEARLSLPSTISNEVVLQIPLSLRGVISWEWLLSILRPQLNETCQDANGGINAVSSICAKELEAGLITHVADACSGWSSAPLSTAHERP